MYYGMKTIIIDIKETFVTKVDLTNGQELNELKK